MKKIYLLCLMLFATLASTAQDFEILSVESMPNDFAAREEIKIDHNDRQCALLRIATQNIAPEQREGFNFKLDYGSEVVERAMRNGEIWLWVSPGLKYIRIMHSDWGQYELYMLDHITRVEALHTYKITIRGIINSPQPNISYSFQELFILTDEKTGMQGAVDINGKLVIPYKYESLSNLEMMKSHFLFVKNSRMGILDNKGKVCVSNLYDDLLPDEDNNVIIAYKNEKLGLIDFSEKILLPFVYDFIDFNEHKGDLVLVGKADYEKEVIKFGVINLKERREVIPCQYEAIILGSTIYEQNHCADPLFIENKSQSPLIAIMKNGKVGFANENGQIVIPCKYDGIDLLDHIAEESSEQDYYTVEDNYNAYIFQDGKSIFIKNGKVGLIDENGKEIVPAIWSSIRNYPSNKITHHFMSGSSFYIHQPKKCTYDYATAVMEGKGSVLLDKNGKECTDYYEDIWEDEGFVVYKENGKYGLLNINTKGKITEAFYDDLYCASEGYIIYKQDEKYGYLDRQGDKKFFNYYNYSCDDVSPFKNGYATVKKDDKYGYVSRSGDYIVSHYDYATPFNEEGLAVVKKDGKYGVINVKEKTIVPFNYVDIDIDEKNKWFVVCIGGWSRWSEGSKLGIVDFGGNEIVEPKYTNEQLEIEIAKYIKEAQRNIVTEE